MEAARPDEFDTIARLFAPLAGPEGLGLLDDAAAYAPPPGRTLALTTDTLVEGVHFLPDDPLDLVARKLLRVNLSDLAAKAAAPVGYLLNCAWSPRCGWAERQAFAAGLAEDQARFGVRLFGGDTVNTPGPLTLSLTAIGVAPECGLVRRAGARRGDRLLVSGTVGDGALGLLAAQGRLDLSAEDQQALAMRYRLPEPRLDLRSVLERFAAAAADVSDGLLADAGRLAVASAVAAAVRLEALPLSAAATRWLDRQADRPAALAWLAAGGDDYEIVLACRPQHAAAAIAAAAELGQTLTEVGAFAGGEGVSATCDGAPMALTRMGWRHA